MLGFLPTAKDAEAQISYAAPVSNRSVLVLLAALALLVGAVALSGCGGSGDDTGGSTTTDGTGGEAGTGPIDLPPELDGLKELVKAVEARKSPAKVVDSQVENQEEVAKATEAAYSKAFDGATAAYLSYSDSDLLHMPYVIAVRAEAPGMTIGPVVDPSFLGLAKPEREVQTIGEVECQVIWSPPVTEGMKPDPSSELTTNCQRSGSGATVYTGAAGYEGPSGLKSLSSFTDAAWEAVVGE
jgi:hypothetical protein